jgi:hypothetical protein
MSTASRLFLILGVAATALALTSPAECQQVTFDGCVDSMGVAVASVQNFAVSDVAQASFASNGAPIILYNPRVLSWFAPQTRLWWYGHECAHHALGHLHLQAFPPAAERQADCWAAKELVRKGLLARSDLQIVAADLARLARGDWSHLPGAYRGIDVISCGGTDIPAEDEKEVSNELSECRIRFRSWERTSGGSASFDLEIEGEDVALIDNESGDDEATIECPRPGTHEYRLRNVEIRAPSGMVAGRGGTCAGQFRVNKSKTIYTITLLAGAGRLRCRLE